MPFVQFRAEKRNHAASTLTADFANAVLAAMIPLIVFTALVLAYENRRARLQTEDLLLDASRRLTEAIDSDLKHQLRTLTTLALSIDLDEPPNFRSFYEEARRALSQHPGWFAISLVDAATTRAVMNTMRPFGDTLPPVGLPEDYAEVVRMRMPLIAGRLGRAGAVIQQPFIALRVPVIRNDQVRYVLSAALSLASVQTLMTEQLDRELPRITRPTAGAAIMDADGRFVARLIEPETFAGRFASEQTQLNMRHGPGIYQGRTIEGLETYGAYSRSLLTDWTIVVGINRADADALANRAFWIILTGSIVSFALTALLARQFGHESVRRRHERERLLLLEADQLLLEQAKVSLVEKETLLREIHHRLKNNMQTIISLLRTSARPWPDEYKATIRTAVRRMTAMVNVHEQLYRSPELAKLELGPYIASIVRDMAIAEGAATKRIDLRIEAEEIQIDLNRALPVGLIVTECLINIFKHAFPDGRAGAVVVSVTSAEAMVNLTIRDNGVGMSSAMTSTHSSLGLDLIDALAHQIGGHAATRSLVGGTEVRVSFPIAAARSQEAPVFA